MVVVESIKNIHLSPLSLDRGRMLVIVNIHVWESRLTPYYITYINVVILQTTLTSASSLPALVHCVQHFSPPHLLVFVTLYHCHPNFFVARLRHPAGKRKCSFSILQITIYLRLCLQFSIYLCVCACDLSWWYSIYIWWKFKVYEEIVIAYEEEA